MPSQFDFRQRFRSIGDASMRHRHTFVGVKDPDTGFIVPRWINEVEGDVSNPRLLLADKEGSESRMNMTDPLLVLERPVIGMSNTQCTRRNKGVAIWWESRASRQIKRSLDFSLLSKNVISNGIVSLNVDSCKYVHVSTFYNESYPSFVECVDKVRQGDSLSAAFSKRFAVGLHLRCFVALYYKGTIVGHVSLNGDAVLIPQFEYLTETLEESLHVDV
tara:strand:+ start:64 stop:717 length:654 start_codon:yes stop_codon:yes gene_type:complete